MSELPALLTYQEAATYCRVSIGTLRHWIATGRLARIKLGRHPLVRRIDLLAMIDKAKP